MSHKTRRRFIQELGLSSATLPLLMGLPSVASAAKQSTRKQRLVVMFSPNGVVQKNFWPEQTGSEFTLPESLKPLEPYQDKTLVLKGVCDRVRGDGDSHMRGMSCLLTGIELFPGNIQGGSHTPAGWASGLSMDQEIKNFLQSKEETQTRFGSLEFGVNVPDRADPWTRMVYSGPNKPVAPIDDPYQMFEKLYGSVKDQAHLRSVLDGIHEDLAKVRPHISSEDYHVLEDHAELVRGLESELTAAKDQELQVPPPEQTPGVKETNENMPLISRMQIELMVSAFANDLARVSTIQYTRSVGQAKMSWIGVDDDHHGLSHKPDSDEDSQEKLTKINKWFCEELAHLTKRLAETPEPDGSGSLLDNTTIVWTNELGKGNSHTLDDIPFVLVGGGLGYKMGRSLQYKRVAHNRLLMAFAHSFGHHVETFGNPDFCGDGVLGDLT